MIRGFCELLLSYLLLFIILMKELDIVYFSVISVNWYFYPDIVKVLRQRGLSFLDSVFRLVNFLKYYLLKLMILKRVKTLKLFTRFTSLRGHRYQFNNLSWINMSFLKLIIRKRLSIEIIQDLCQ